MSDIKYMDVDDFRNGGYLHEVNRQLLHPLGLALEVSASSPTELEDAFRKLVDDAGEDTSPADVRKIVKALMEWATSAHMEFGWVSGVWDYRDDPEGMLFGELDHEKIAKVSAAWSKREPRRRELLGFMVQDRNVTTEEMEQINQLHASGEGD